MIEDDFYATLKLNSGEEIEHNKFNIKPGITGLWELTNPQKIAKLPDTDMDIFYIQNQSFFLDVIIFFKMITLLFKRALLTPYTKN